jgi:GGDEF domain-containing protein
VPEDVLLTSFSILFSNYKGDLKTQIDGVKALDNLKDGDRVLISEGCTHHRQCKDIGTVKMPEWVMKYTKKDIYFDFTSGGEFPEDLSKYALIMHCGGCTLNEREMKYRINCAKDKGVPIANYGTTIAYMNGILKRSVEIFPEYYDKLKKDNDKITYFHLFSTAISKVIYNKPLLNRFVINGNYYDRNEVTLSFVAKTEFTDEAKELFTVMRVEKNDDVNIESENNANDYVPQNEEQPENDIMLEEENQIDLDLELEAQEKAQENSQFNPFASNISDPQGLFSKFTGLGWESYLETRLDSELGRAASAEQDLAFFLIAIENFNFQNQIIPHLTSILLEKFKFRDLVFEYGTNGFAAIVQGMNLDRAMALTQELYTDISGLLVNYQMNNKFGIGITTRSLRLITGNRLIDEAQQALNKAFDEEGLPIVAFRVNPEKYRQCLADNE